MADVPVSPDQPADHTSVHVGDADARGRRISPWAWIPSVYFAQGLQYSVVVQVFAIAFFTMGIAPGDTLFWVGVISFPWMIKPLWGPLVDKYGTKRGWTWLMQLTVGAAFVGTAVAVLAGNSMVLGLPLFLAASLVLLALLALGAATHDIACDGFYMLGLSEKEQAFFVGMRSTFFQAAMMFANGGLIWIAGVVQTQTGLPAVETRLIAREASASASANQSSPDLFEMLPGPASQSEAIQIMPESLDLVAGESGILSVRLSQPPAGGETRVVVLRLQKGDKGIAIPKEYTRLEFTGENWQRGFDIPVSCDARLRGEQTDTVVAQAGNIPLSWSVVALICAAIFLGVATWHRKILPYPAADGSARAEGRPPFLVAVGCLALTVGIPFLACWGFVKVAGTLREDIRTATIGEVRSPAFQDLRQVLESKDGADRPDTDSLWASIESIRADKATGTVAGLKAAIDLRRILVEAGLPDDMQSGERLAECLYTVGTHPDVYGNPRLKAIQGLLKTTSGGVLPADEAAMQDALGRVMDPGLGQLSSDGPSGALAAIAAVEAAWVSFADDGDSSPSGGMLPSTRTEFDRLVATAMETPTRLEVKGFDSLFTVCRMLLLVVLAMIVLKVPVFWSPIRNAVYRLSDISGIGYAEVFATFFSKPGIATTLAFLLTYRLGKSQLTQVKNLFLLDTRDAGGLGLSLGEVALINSVTYLGLLTAGSLLGGFLIARVGLKRAIWPMVAFMHLPGLLYYQLSASQPLNLIPIHVVVGIESFGHGFGFAAYLMIMILAAQGPYKTAHYALCTGAMALGNMIPGMWAGYIQELVGYRAFFLLAMAFAIPGTLLIPMLKLDLTFGKRD